MAALDDSYDHYRDRCPVERDSDAIYEPEEERHTPVSVDSQVERDA